MDKIPVRNFELNSLRGQIGILLHQHDIFDDNIRTNARQPVW